MDKESKKKKGPGKHFREGMSLVELMRKFPNKEVAEKWFVKNRWPDGISCPRCGSVNIQTKTTHPEMPFRCRDCRKFFSVKTGTVTQGSNLNYQVWVIAIFLLTTNLKGVSSMKLHRDLDITQKAAWHLAHRIRETWKDKLEDFAGPCEADETHVGGKERNKRPEKRSHTRGPGGKAVVVGIKDRKTNKIVAKPVPNRSKEELQGFIGSNVTPEAKVYTDDHRSYIGLPYDHESVNHSVGEYVKGMAHTNGIESFWAALKRGYYGTYHRRYLRSTWSVMSRNLQEGITSDLPTR